MLNKLGTVSDVTYDIGEKWRVIGYHKHYRWEDETKNFLLVSENNDSGWIDRIAFLESLNEKKTIYYALDFIPLVLKYTPEQFAKIMNAVPWIGMKEEDLILSYGNPDDTHTTISGNTISKQYVYGKTASLYFYFTNGKLTTIQD